MVESHRHLERGTTTAHAAVRAGHRLILVGGGDGSMTTAVGVLAHTKAVLGRCRSARGTASSKAGIKPDLESASMRSRRPSYRSRPRYRQRHPLREFRNGRSVVVHRTKHPVVAQAHRRAGGLRHRGDRTAVVKRRVSRDDRGERAEDEVAHAPSDRRQRPVLRFLTGAARCDDRRRHFALFASTGLTRWDVARIVLASIERRRPARRCGLLHAATITIKTKPKQYLDIDGEPLGKTPARFQIDPRALRVMVPRSSTARDRAEIRMLAGAAACWLAAIGLGVAVTRGGLSRLDALAPAILAAQTGSRPCSRGRATLSSLQAPS